MVSVTEWLGKNIYQFISWKRGFNAHQKLISQSYIEFGVHKTKIFKIFTALNPFSIKIQNKFEITIRKAPCILKTHKLSFIFYSHADNLKVRFTPILCMQMQNGWCHYEIWEDGKEIHDFQIDRILLNDDDDSSVWIMVICA